MNALTYNDIRPKMHSNGRPYKQISKPVLGVKFRELHKNYKMSEDIQECYMVI